MTLSELLVSLLLIGMVGSGLVASTTAMNASWATGQHRVGIASQGRNATDWMARRIRLAGQGAPLNATIYVLAESGQLGFWADVIPGSGASVSNPMDYVHYSISGGRLVESVTSGGTTTARNLTSGEEVGAIAVTSVNFCYYNVFHALLDQTETTQPDGSRTCAGTVSADNLGAIHRVQIRLALASGRAGESPMILNTTVAPRLEVMP